MRLTGCADRRNFVRSSVSKLTIDAVPHEFELGLAKARAQGRQSRKPAPVDTSSRKGRSRSIPVAENPTSPGSKGFLLLNEGGTPSEVSTWPPAASKSATPPATSHSCFGTNVQVASAFPAATSANL